MTASPYVFFLHGHHTDPGQKGKVSKGVQNGQRGRAPLVCVPLITACPTFGHVPVAIMPYPTIGPYHRWRCKSVP